MTARDQYDLYNDYESEVARLNSELDLINIHNDRRDAGFDIFDSASNPRGSLIGQGYAPRGSLPIIDYGIDGLPTAEWADIEQPQSGFIDSDLETIDFSGLGLGQPVYETRRGEISSRLVEGEFQALLSHTGGDVGGLMEARRRAETMGVPRLIERIDGEISRIAPASMNDPDSLVATEDTMLELEDDMLGLEYYP